MLYEVLPIRNARLPTSRWRVKGSDGLLTWSCGYRNLDGEGEVFRASRLIIYLELPRYNCYPTLANTVN